MQWAEHQQPVRAPARWRRSLRCRRSCAVLLSIIGAVLAAAQQGPGTPAAGALPTAPAAHAGQAAMSSAIAERRKQIAGDSAKLLALATDLKAEVDKTTKDTLSLAVVRKAEAIEKLAHAVREGMK